MLVLFLICLMKLVDISNFNRLLRYCGGSKENHADNGQQIHQNFYILEQQKLQHLLLLQQLLNELKQRKFKIKNHNKCNLQQNKKEKSFYRGMTEHPLAKNRKSVQSNHCSSHHNLQHQKKHPNSPNTNYNNGFLCQNQSFIGKTKTYPINNLFGELTDETLKQNVQIVLRNLDRYNNAMRSIIINEQTNINYNNNISNNKLRDMVSSPESDFNSNGPYHPFGHLNCSIASSHDFTHDNSDYQWFVDYGYRDSFTHQSVLSSLSASYNGIGELSYYEDLAKNIDANLAEVDIDCFQAEDIHSLLTRIPPLCKQNRRNEQDLDNSICKSELLFSPVKESHISIDSLDLESYRDDGDIILTCQANKDNYTIAFEGSTLYSDESFYAELAETNNKAKHNLINPHSNLDDIVKRKSLEVSMSRSDHAFTTWSKLKKSSTIQLQRYPSGNNNTSVHSTLPNNTVNCIVRKSSSLPNILIKKSSGRQLNVSQAKSSSSASSNKSRNLLPMCQIPISSTSGSESHQNDSNTQSSSQSFCTNKNQPAFNLVKLFIKQKSGSSDTCMDVSSGCWPSDASTSSERVRKKSMNDSGKGSALSRHNEENEIPDSSSFQLDSLDICDQPIINSEESISLKTTPKKTQENLYRKIFDSPSYRATVKENLHNQPFQNTQTSNLILNNNNNNSLESNNHIRDNINKSISDGSKTSENLTQVFLNNNSRHNPIKIPAEMITRSMQTSILSKERFKLIPPSFLAKLNKFGEENRAPVYVIYPNYALPDLGFVKNNLSDVILSPMNYKEALGTKRRPTSLTISEAEKLKNINHNSIDDWKSLVTLLPLEYRKRLQQIPEADIDLDPTCTQRPLFTVSSFKRLNNPKTICDCANYFLSNTSSSGSSQQPSSGYRGSSTILTDSDFDAGQNINNINSDPMKNMFVYQYENNRMENDIKEKPPFCNIRTPRGILRKNLKLARTKRNSMFEGNSSSNIKNLEKRRSLQEPYYIPDDYSIIEEYLADINEKETNSNIRQKRKMLDEKGEILNEKRIIEEKDMEARARAENFLSNVPKCELKYYAEIASILESVDGSLVHYDPAKLKNEVSKALSQKRVSFIKTNQINDNNSSNLNFLQTGLPKKFSTPPNSPNISIAGLHVNNNNNNINNKSNNQRLKEQNKLMEKKKSEKISNNRFKRLQIQWELLSKDSSVLLKDLARETETKSGGSTPTSNGPHKSRIPRPVSYPASRATTEPVIKPIRSPSRIVPPKKYSVPAMPISSNTGLVTNKPITPIRPKTPNRHNNTPKKSIPFPKTRTR